MKFLRKAISPIIATVLLILIAIATGIVIYAFAAGWVGTRFSEATGPQAILVIESAYYNGSTTNPYFVLYVRNDGTVNVNISGAYITSPEGTITYFNATTSKREFSSIANIYGVFAMNRTYFDAPVKIYPALIPANGSAVKIIIALNDELSVSRGSVYTIKLVATDGSTVTIRVRA